MFNQLAQRSVFFNYSLGITPLLGKELCMDFQLLRFYLFRVRRASFPEIAARIKERYLLRKLKKNIQLSLPPKFDSLVLKTKVSSLRFSKIHEHVNGETASWLLEGNVYTLGFEQAEIRQFEKKWQKRFFTEVRPREDDPDIRAVWEPARLQHLMLLLQYLQMGDSGSHRDVETSIQSELLYWIASNPFPYGPHYISAMECGLRIPVLFRTLLLLESLSSDEYEKVCLAIFQHGWLIRNRLSLYSSLGNHTVAESIGLIMAGALFREDDLCREWLSTGIKLLEQECFHQILADGGPAEQSFSYHRFVLDLYWLAIEFLTKNELHDCRAMKQRVEQGEQFLDSIQGDDEVMPNVGDSDDGFAVAPGLSPQKDIGDIGAVSPVEDLASFPESGYTLFRNNDGLRILFDHGPLGMEPLNNHGHADALSVLLTVKDKDFLIDPGTFQYNGDPELRRYFKGTSAHNTVCIDGLDQAKQLTGFIWERSFVCRGTCGRIEGGCRMEGWHDGYRKQNVSVTHYRTVLCKPGGEVVIEDRFEGKGNHEYALHFHLHPNVIVERREGALYLQRGDFCLEMELDSGFILLKGQKKPLAGWYSPAYGEMVASTTVQLVKQGLPGDVRFTTRFKVIAVVS
jgi:hypothetical protein